MDLNVTKVELDEYTYEKSPWLSSQTTRDGIDYTFDVFEEVCLLRWDHHQSLQVFSVPATEVLPMPDCHPRGTPSPDVRLMA